MPGRQYTAANGYRYGFNGKENDNEVKGEGNQQDYGMRIYDPQLGKFLSVDPLSKGYPELTPYQFASNTPVQAVDLDGSERLDMTDIMINQRKATITIAHTTEIVRSGLAAELLALNNATYANSFTNTTLYVRTLPQNGTPIDFISRKEYNRGVGFLLNIVFDVQLSYIATISNKTFGSEFSTMEMAPSRVTFTGPDAFAKSSNDQSNWVVVNPAFQGFVANGAVPMSENYEELIAHEVGFHNMMGLLHASDASGKGIYPAPGIRTLESATHSDIQSTNDNVMKILSMNITTRRNLVNVPIVPIGRTPLGNITNTPAVTTFKLPSMPNIQKSLTMPNATQDSSVPINNEANKKKGF